MSELDYPTTLTPEQVREYPVLCVDDEPANLEIFNNDFGHLFDVHVAHDANEALAIISEQNIAVLIADYRMPGLSGVDLHERVRELRPQVRRVLVTAYADKRMAIDAINRGGVHHFLTKPWNPAHVLQVLHGLLANVHLDRKVRTLQRRIVNKERVETLAHSRGGILHDLAGVTMGIGASAHYLKEQLVRAYEFLPGPLRGELERELEGLHKHITHITELHERARRLGAPRRVNPRAWAAHELVEHAVELVRRDLTSRIEVEVNVPTGLTVLADRVDVARVLTNLLRNAADAIRRARHSRGRIEIGAHTRGPDVAIHVSDDGPGVPRALSERVFELAWSSTHEEGRGFGLYVCRELTEANGGRLELSSRRAGAGAEFILRLPSAKALRDEVPTSPTPPPITEG